MVRLFRAADRDGVRRLCCDNGYLGNPIEAAFTDRALFAAIFIDPYVEHYPDWTFVAEHDGEVVGYLTAAIGMKYLIRQVVSGCAAVCRLLLGSFFGEEGAKDGVFCTGCCSAAGAKE
jgi:hypothetical protein